MPADVAGEEQSDGSVSLRIRGLEFARASAGKLTCGITRRSRCTVETAAAMAGEIARVRNADTEDRQHPLYSANPEGWLESQVREGPGAIDASLLAAPLYGQVPVFTGGDRGVIDLLGIDHSGRLVVIEIKATADLQLPFQALDYWLRVCKHLTAGDFERLGYFAGNVISPEAPRILLVAPALEFHSTIETLLSALMPSVEITRVGLAADWRSGLRVMFRLRGAEHP
jgi:RecB family endonuclease NucS